MTFMSLYYALCMIQVPRVRSGSAVVGRPYFARALLYYCTVFIYIYCIIKYFCTVLYCIIVRYFAMPWPYYPEQVLLSDNMSYEDGRQSDSKLVFTGLLPVCSRKLWLEGKCGKAPVVAATDVALQINNSPCHQFRTFDQPTTIELAGQDVWQLMGMRTASSSETWRRLSSRYWCGWRCAHWKESKQIKTTNCKAQVEL